MRRKDRGGILDVWERGEVYAVVWRGDERKMPLEKQGVDGKIILKWIYKEWDGGADWIDVAQNKGRWRASLMR